MSDSEHEMKISFTLDVSTKITIAIVVLNFALFLFILFLYFRAKGLRRILPSSRYSSRRLIFAPYEPSLPRRALDPSILNALPVTIFKEENYIENGGLDCAVCISEIADGEEVRLLPKCQHGFHVECIDMWFGSNSTCPLCRIPVTAESSSEILVQDLGVVSENGHSLDVLNEVGCSSSCSTSSGKCREGMLLIDIPRRKVDGFSTLVSPLPMSSSQSPSTPLLTSRGASEGLFSPSLGKLKSFRRMLSRGNGKGVGTCSFSPRGSDVEEQEGSVDFKCQ